MLRVFQFQVVGNFPFPVDMLRYDGCYPLHESPDSTSIMQSQSRFRQDAPHLGEDVLRALGIDPNSEVGKSKRAWVVTLEKVTDQSTWAPTAGRWESFMWRVLPGSQRRLR